MQVGSLIPNNNGKGLLLNRSRLYPILLAISALVIVAACCSGLYSSPAMAQDDQDTHDIYYDYIKVDINILANSDMEVTETRKFVGTPSDFQYGYRWIYTHQFDSIDNVEVLENGQEYTENPEVRAWIEEQIAGGSPEGDAHTFATWTEENRFWVGWWVPESIEEDSIFTVKYVVHGGIRIADDGDQLRWEVICEPRDGFVYWGWAHVYFPQPVSYEELQVDADRSLYNDIAPDIKMTDDRTLRIKAQHIYEDEGLRVKVTFPHGIVAGEKPLWQKEIERWSGGEIFVLILAIVIFVGVFGSIAAYKTRLRKYRLVRMIGRLIWER